ncbi:MAG: hypothetical protein ACSLEY_02940 [Candidatus Saccharimonadales bacterium]
MGGNQEEAVKAAIRQGDYTKMQSKYKEYCESMTRAGQKPKTLRDLGWK